MLSKKKGKRLAILASGGPAPGINSVINAAVSRRDMVSAWKFVKEMEASGVEWAKPCSTRARASPN